MVRLSRRDFEGLVLEALETLPPTIQARLDNVDLVVMEWPSKADLEQAGLQNRYQLFGLYHGVPLPERSHYDVMLPDKITVFQRPIEAACATRADVVREVKTTVIHEVAHYFGIGDDDLEGTEYG